MRVTAVQHGHADLSDKVHPRLLLCGEGILSELVRCIERRPNKVRVAGGPERAFFGGASPRCLGDQSGDA